MKTLITGYCGFVGPYLARQLMEEGHEVLGSTFLPIDHRKRLFGDVDRRIAQKYCDFTKTKDVKDLVRWADADKIFHLAGLSHVPTAKKNPELTHDINVDGAERL